MGWCSATEIFDKVAEALLDNKKKNPKEIQKILNFIFNEPEYEVGLIKFKVNPIKNTAFFG